MKLYVKIPIYRGQETEYQFGYVVGYVGAKEVKFLSDRIYAIVVIDGVLDAIRIDALEIISKKEYKRMEESIKDVSNYESLHSVINPDRLIKQPIPGFEHSVIHTDDIH